jgi:hypothetical protein
VAGLAVFLGCVIVAFSPFQVGMNARRETLWLGKALEQRDELRALWRVEGSQQLGLVLFCDALELGQQLAALGSQVERVRAPVDGVATSLGEPAMLEVVDKGDYGAAVDPQRTAQCLLGLALVDGELAEHPEVPRVEVEVGKALGEAPMPMGAQLHQQEAGTPAQPPRRGCLNAGGVSGHAADGTAPLELFLL